MRSITDKKRMESKKGQLSQMTGAILTLVLAATVLVFGIVMLQELRDTNQLLTGAAGCNATDTSACGEAYDAANTTLSGLGTFSDFWEIIVLAIVITVVIGLLVGVFGGRQR